MKKIIICFFGMALLVSLTDCKRCSKKEQEKYYTSETTPPSQVNLTLGDGFFGDCSMTKTGTNDLFKIKVKVRGISGVDAGGTPITFVYRSYIWPGISNSVSNYAHSIDVPNTGGFFLDVSIESNGCVKCCTDPTTCPANFGNVELAASMLINGTVAVPNPVIFPASLFTKTCY